MKAPFTFEEYLHRLKHTNKTIKSYLYSVSIFLSDNPIPEDYEYKDIVEYMKEKSSKDNSPSIKLHLLHAIKKYYDYLVAIERRSDHPCKSFNINTYRRKTVILQDLFSSKELEMLMEREERYIDLMLRNKVVISLLIYQGLTSSEIENLNLSNIDLDNGTIFVKASRKISQRRLEINNKQFRLFQRYIEEGRKNLLRENTNAFLLGKLGSRISVDDINYLVSTFKPLFPDRNLNPGTIRQSVISNWLNEKKYPIEQVQLLSGQRWISSTARYKSNLSDKDREIMNKFFPLK